MRASQSPSRSRRRFPDRPDGEEHSHHRRSLLRGLHPRKSAAAQVVEVTMSDGTIKHLSTINYEPLVVDVALDRLLDA